MKVLKIIIGIIVVVGIGYVGYLATLPDNYRIERTIVINANAELIKNNITNFNKWDAWSPWVEKDTNAKYSFEGNDGQVGAKMSWSGNDLVGIGNVTISAIEGNSTVTYDLVFTEPWQSESVGVFKLSEVDGGIKVAWVTEGDFKIPMRLFGGLNEESLDKLIGDDFEKGLSNLKSVIEEKIANAKPVFNIEEVVVESFPYLSQTDSCTIEEIGATLGKLYGGVMGYCGANNIAPAGKPFAIYHSWDKVATRITAGIPLMEATEGNDNVQSGTSFAGNALKVTYVGPYEKSGDVHLAIHAYIKENGKEYAGPPWEIYITDPGSEPDPNNYITEVYYPVK